MNRQKKKMKFLSTKLSALQSELLISREIVQSASREVEAMFTKKYFPETLVNKESNNEDTDMKERTGEEPEQEQEQKAEKQQKTTKQQIPDPDQLPENSSADKSADPEVKKMFKKIASKCHPDKLQDLKDGFEKDKKEELYQKARKALESNDLLLMADVAQDLGIEIPEISEAQLKLTEQKIVAIKKELQMIESTLVWHWFFTEDQKQKDKILKKLFELMYANHPGS